MQDSFSKSGQKSEVVEQKDLIREIVEDVVVTKEADAKPAKKPEKKVEKGGVFDEAIVTATALFGTLDTLSKANPGNALYRRSAHQAKILQMVISGQY